MGAQKKEQSVTNTEVKEKKSTRKAAVFFILIVAAITTLVLFAQEYFAKEQAISQTSITVNGKVLIVNFFERSGSYTHKDPSTGVRESGTSHYGYFLELVDSATKKSIQKIKFKSPVWTIQTTPQMIIVKDIIWIVSANENYSDPQDFILKFSFTENRIKPLEFTLDEKYHARAIEGRKIMLTKGSDFYHGNNNPFFGNLYLDLETEEIVVDDSKKY